MDVRSAYWQFSVSSQHMVKSLTVNPYMSLFAPIFGQQISILDHPLTLDFLVRLGMNFHPMGDLRGRGVGWAGDNYFCHRRKRDYLSRASQRARGATKNVTIQNRVLALSKLKERQSDCDTTACTSSHDTMPAF